MIEEWFLSFKLKPQNGLKKVPYALKKPDGRQMFKVFQFKAPAIEETLEPWLWVLLSLGNMT